MPRGICREADRAAAAGRIAEALQLAFVGLALTLDGAGLLRYHASKTPAECAREARLAAEDRERLRGLVRALYGTSSAGGPCAPDDYRRWREASRRSLACARALSWRSAPRSCSRSAVGRGPGRPAAGRG